MKYSQELRETVTRKTLEGTMSQEAIAKEFGVGRSTIQNWLRQDRQSGVTEVVKRERRPEDWTAQERLNALIESSALSEDELGAWCRGQGLHTHHLERWRRELIEGQGRGKGSQSKLRALREENRSLKQELRRKEKALAETAALLVLKKKAASIWGEPEDD
jgi:transposase-like protein